MKNRLYIVFIALCLTTQWSYSETVLQGSGPTAEGGLTLDSCLVLARQNNPTLRKAQLEVLKAREVKSQALTKYFPQIKGTAFGFHALQPLVEVGIDDIGNATVRDLLNALYGFFGPALGLENSINFLHYGYAAGVMAIQPVFVGGKIVAGNKLAKVGVEAAELQAQMAERDGLEQVEETYWLVYGIEQKQHLIDDATALLDTAYQQVSAAVNAGLALPSDLMQVEMKRDDIARRQLQVASGRILARRALALSIGLPDTVDFVLADSLSGEAGLSVERSFSDNGLSGEAGLTPERELLDLQVRAAKLQRYMVIADALPQIALGASYGYSRFQTNLLRDGIGNKNGNGALFVTVSVPLTAWWETAHKIRQHDYAIQQAQIDIDNLGTQLDLRTQQAYDQWTQALALLQLQQRTAEHAEEAYRQAEANYAAGLITITDLLQAHTALLQARSDLSDAQISVRITHRRYTDLIARH